MSSPPPAPPTPAPDADRINVIRDDIWGGASLDTLRTLQAQLDVISPAPPANSINVIRADVLGSAFRAFRRRKFNPKMNLSVVFVDACGQGEGAVDTGGPKREFINLLMKALINSRFFVGPPESRSLTLVAVCM